jgi:sulfur relay (sulfurtransferase) DsrC/TusE family protein
VIETQFENYLTTHFAENSSLSKILSCGAYGDIEKYVPDAMEKIVKFLAIESGVDINSKDEYFELLNKDAREFYFKYKKNPQKYMLSIEACNKILTDANKIR